MKTKSGYETNGTYLKYKSGYTASWCVEIERGVMYFQTEREADKYISVMATGSDLWNNSEKEFIKECENQLLPKWKQ